MTGAGRRVEGRAAGLGRRVGLCWAVFSTLLIVLGLAGPGPAAARPSVEYKAPEPPAVVRVCDDPAPAIFASCTAPVRAQGVAVSPASHDIVARPEREGLCAHPYEAIGPPRGELFKAA